MDERVLKKVRLSFFQRNQTNFLTTGFQALLSTYIPWIVQTHGSVSVVINGLKYAFTLTNVRVFNSGVHISECFAHSLSNRVPITADFQLDVVPLLAADKQPPRILSQVRSVVLQCPVPTKINMMSTPGLEDPEVENHVLHAGIFIGGGKMRTIPCIKSMMNNTVLLTEFKKSFRLQLRSDHEGNRTMDEANPFRSTSSLDFEVAKQLKRSALEGEITCKLPFSKQKVHIAVLAQAFGCAPEQFVELIRKLSGKDYDAPTFRCYEIDILYSVRDIHNQNEAIMALSKLSGKETPSTGVNLLKTEIFPHLNIMFDRGNKEKLYFMKLFFLAMCTSMLILFVAHKIPETSRDLWQYASIQMPAMQIGTLIRAKFTNHISMFAKLLRRELLRIAKKAPENQTYPDLVKLFGEVRLSKHCMSAVLSGAFSKKKQGVSIQLNDNNEDAIMKQLLRISSSLKTTDSTHTNPRKVQRDSYANVCAASTSDGDKVGLENEIGCTATITTDLQDPKSLAELLEYLLNVYLLDLLKTLQPKIVPNVLVHPDTSVQDNNISLSVELISSVDFTLLQDDWYIYINNCGVPTHFVKPEDLKALVSHFRKARRAGDIPRHTFLKISHYPRQIRIMSEGGQIVRPLLVLENLNKITSSSMSFWDMVQHGIIEYVNTAESESLCKIIVCFKDLYFAIEHNQHKDLTHMEISDASFVGVMAASVVFLTSIQGPRLAYATHTKTQVMTAGRKRNRGSIQSTEIWHSHKELVRTKIADSIPEAADGRGFPAVVAFIALDRDQEDAFIAHQQAIDRGMFVAMTTRHYTSDIKAPTNVLSERFEKSHNVLSKKHQCYDAIQDNGYPLVGAKIAGGDVVLSKTRNVRKASYNTGFTNKQNNNKKARIETTTTSTTTNNGGGSASTNASLGRTLWISRRDISHTTRKDEGGTVREVEEKATMSGKRGRVSVVTPRRLKRGDKVNSKHSQKGVGGAILSTADMPFSERTGMVPDIIISPLGITSRMTMASCLEGGVGKAVCVEGDTDLGVDQNEYDGNNKKYLESAGDYLVKNGFKRNAAEYFRDGKTGKRYKSESFMGVIYYHQLIHIAEKKLHYRSRGPRCPLTRQARKGKRQEGGLRWGELESAAAIGQGAAACLQARVRESSDPFEIFVCKECKSLADGNKFTGYRWCCACQRTDTVYIVKAPFTFHLNQCELAAIGVKMAIDIKPSLNLLVEQKASSGLELPPHKRHKTDNLQN